MNKTKNINETLYNFLFEGSIWQALSSLQDTKGSRYGAYCALIELTQACATGSLDEAFATGEAMYLAEQLIGRKALQSTMVAVIKYAIKSDTEDEDLTEMEARMLQKLLKVSIS